ncbi:hypothetical protein B0H19DRAFT_1253899 [Mycena capillaripes]|nr:hypothetical protein B0H19DRAFT_1253899 [Mycena capillaripes]
MASAASHFDTPRPWVGTAAYRRVTRRYRRVQMVGRGEFTVHFAASRRRPPRHYRVTPRHRRVQFTIHGDKLSTPALNKLHSFAILKVLRLAVVNFGPPPQPPRPRRFTAASTWTRRNRLAPHGMVGGLETA